MAKPKDPPKPKKKGFSASDAFVTGLVLAAIAGFGDNVVGDGAQAARKPEKSVVAERKPEKAQTRQVKTALAYAHKQLGKPYLWGGTGPHAFDCSGLVQAAWKSAGVKIPRTTFVQWRYGQKVKPGQERPGDLVFFNSGPGTSPDNPGHVGLVADPEKGLMYEARCRKCGGIKLTSYRTRGDLVGFRRVVVNA